MTGFTRQPCSCGERSDERGAWTRHLSGVVLLTGAPRRTRPNEASLDRHNAPHRSTASTADAPARVGSVRTLEQRGQGSRSAWRSVEEHTTKEDGGLPLRPARRSSQEPGRATLAPARVGSVVTDEERGWGGRSTRCSVGEHDDGGGWRRPQSSCTTLLTRAPPPREPPATHEAPPGPAASVYSR